MNLTISSTRLSPDSTDGTTSLIGQADIFAGPQGSHPPGESRV